MSRTTIIQRIGDCGVVAVIRAPDPRKVMPLVEALVAGGVLGIEVTMSTPKASEVIAELAATLGDKIILGAGTVMDSATCSMVIHAGARFVVSPITDAAIIETTRRLGCVSVPGAYTPTEIFRAANLGADIVKVFPATTLGPGYFKDILAVMPHLKLTPTGGVDTKTAGAFIAAGAVAVGAGSSLISKAALSSGDFSGVTQTAREFIAAVQAARKTAAPAK